MKDAKKKKVCGNGGEDDGWPERGPTARARWQDLKDASSRVSTSTTCSTCDMSAECVFISQECCMTHCGALCSTDILVKAVWCTVNWDLSISTCVTQPAPIRREHLLTVISYQIDLDLHARRLWRWLLTVGADSVGHLDGLAIMWVEAVMVAAAPCGSHFRLEQGPWFSADWLN